MERGKVGRVRAVAAADNKGPCRARGAGGVGPSCKLQRCSHWFPGQGVPAPLRRRGGSIGSRSCRSAERRGGAEVCRRARGGVRCAPLPRWPCSGGQAALRSGAAAALLCPSQLASAAGREGQDFFPYEGGGRARAAVAGVVWGRGEEGAGTAPCLCPAGGAGRSQPDGSSVSCVWLVGLFFPHYSHYSQPSPYLSSVRRTYKRLSLLLLPWCRTTRRRKELAGMHGLPRRKMAFFLHEGEAEEAQEKAWLIQPRITLLCNFTQETAWLLGDTGMDALWNFINFMKGKSGQRKAIFSYLEAGSKVNLSASVVSPLNDSILQGEKANK
ncbi:uncharacterized protein LOC120411540 [Corvus cornix cornix]|uniref:uncharacterized protein LOC120411540 n=1 Tax=Corvus cornix cornix TaxID=932674 RepID=UPI00194E7420|nr:uncharacterized protein LOC120411540 [Corvus cornix cornix]